PSPLVVGTRSQAAGHASSPQPRTQANTRRSETRPRHRTEHDATHIVAPSQVPAPRDLADSTQPRPGEADRASSLTRSQVEGILRLARTLGGLSTTTSGCSVRDTHPGTRHPIRRRARNRLAPHGP